MAQSGYTPISLYFSATGAAVPTAANLVAGELALNTNDGKLYFKNSAGVVTLLAGSTSGPAGGSNTQVQYNNAGVLAGITGATTNGTALTLVAPNLGSPSSVGTMPAFTLGGTVSGGGNQINNVVIGTTTPLAGAFTSLTASTTLGVTGVSTLTGGAIVQGLTVGLGAGAVATNTAVGSGTLGNNSTGAQNTAVGYRAGLLITSGDKNTAFGASIMDQGAGVTGQENAAFGRVNMRPLTSGSYNTALGNESLLKLTSGSNNTAVGFDALLENTTASNNTAVGYQAGYSQVNGSGNNVLVGYQAGYTNVAGTGNTFVGCQAGYTANYTSATSTFNTCIGFAAGYSLTTGTYNTFIGGSGATSGGSGSAITSGSKNVILGKYNGNEGGLDIRTASNYIVLSDGDGNPWMSFDSSGAAFFNASAYVSFKNNAYIRTDIASSFAVQSGASTTVGFQVRTADNATTKLSMSGNGGTSLALEGATPQSGVGLTFPATQSASSDANTLDDYEEGLHTTTANANTTLDTSYRAFKYTKVGNVVTVVGLLQITGSSGTDTLTFTLPFTAAADQTNGQNRSVGGCLPYYVTTGTGGMVPFVQHNTAIMNLYKLTLGAATNSGYVAATNADVINGSSINFNVTYLST